MQHTEIGNFYNNLKALQEEFINPVPDDDSLITVDFNNEFCVLKRIQTVTYEKDFPRYEAFENVISALNVNNEQSRFVYYLKGTPNGVEFYVGVAFSYSAKRDKQTYFNVLYNYLGIFEKAFSGNFLGTEFVNELTEEGFKKDYKKTLELQETLSSDSLYYSILLGIPSKNSEKDAVSFQGIDRLVNIMSGTSFHLLVVWKQLKINVVDFIDTNIKDIHEELQKISKYSYQESSQDIIQTLNKELDSESKDTVITKRSHSDYSKNTQSNPSSKESNTTSEGKGTSEDSSENKTKLKESSTDTIKSKTETQTKSYDLECKKSSELLKYIDEELLERIKQGKSKGLYKTAVYLAAENTSDLVLLENSVSAILQGDKPVFYPLHGRRLPQTKKIRKLISNFCFWDKIPVKSNYHALCSRMMYNGMTSLATNLTASEISLLASMPQREVLGLELREQVGFGLNVKCKKENGIFLGTLYQEGKKLYASKVFLNKDDLNKHIFIAGTTGSGKTTTCHRLLSSANLPFLVIEPAKTEYRVLLNDINLHNMKSSKPKDKILLFTVGNEQAVPFRFNPFEILPYENVSGHIDLLKASFMASFHMEAAIPNLLEEALFVVYQRFGWNLATNENMFLKNRLDAWKNEFMGCFFPTVSDYIETLVALVKQKKFGERLESEYLGSILGRLDVLRTGTKGMIFDTRVSADFRELTDRKVIIELEDVKSGEDKSFIMSLILGRMVEVIKEKNTQDKNYKHVTLVEEAHRLLSKLMPGDTPNKKLGVDMFCDLLAEVRKYGESLIIVDQIPNKLASEVLKNTNTKIIHKLFARDDKDVVGDTMALDDKQKSYLSLLSPGESVIFSQGWYKPVNVQIEQLENCKTTGQEVKVDNVYHAGWDYWLTNPTHFCSAVYGCGNHITKEELIIMGDIYVNLQIMFRKQTENKVLYEMIEYVKDKLSEKAIPFLHNVFYLRMLTLYFLREQNYFRRTPDCFKKEKNKFKEVLNEFFSYKNYDEFKKYFVKAADFFE